MNSDIILELVSKHIMLPQFQLFEGPVAGGWSHASVDVNSVSVVAMPVRSSCAIKSECRTSESEV